MTHQKTALILGRTGKFGRHAASAFEARGWTVRRFDRKADTLPDAAADAHVIVMGWHPGGYDTWERDLLLMHRRVIDAARKTGATVIVPGNVYVYGPDAPPGWTEEPPKMAPNPHGRLRTETEDLYRSPFNL